MTKLNHSNIGNFIAGSAGLLCAVCLYSTVTNQNQNVKSFALNLAMLSGGVALSSYAVDKVSRDSIDYQINELVSKHQLDLNLTKQNLNKVTGENQNNLNRINELELQLNSKNDELVKLETFAKVLKGQSEIKINELTNRLNTKDTSVDELKQTIKKAFWQVTRDRIHTDYERLGDLITKKLKREDFENIHNQLREFYQQLKNNHAYHCELLSEINEVDINSESFAEELINIFFTVSDQTAALKVKLRNLLHLDVKQTLEDALEELTVRRDPKQFVPREKVISNLDKFQQGSLEDIQKLKNSFNLNKAGFEELKEQVADLLDEIDNKNLEISDLKERVKLLEKEVDRPKQFLGKGTYAEIGNRINTYYYEAYRYRLDAYKWAETETGYELVYSFTRSPGLTITDLEQNNSIAKIASLTNALYKTLPKFDINYQFGYLTLTVTTRNAPKKETPNEEMYKDGLIPASQFCDRIYKALDTKQEGKPTLRVMAATGEGKGIALKNLLAYWVDLPDWEIWLSDPVDGSDEDYWDCSKIATNPNEAGKVYNKFVDLHKSRQNQLPAFTDRFVLGVFDEFDKQHDDDDKESAKAIMTAIRHTKQRQILIGQCAEVGANGWTWDDMNNCGLLVLGNSIGTLCKHLTKDMGWTTARANQVKKAYEKFSDWARKNNEANPDIPNENRYRIALLIVSGRYEFLEIPNAHKGIIRSGQALIRKSLSTNTQKPVFSNSLNYDLNSVEDSNLKHILQCPNSDCLSTNVGTKGSEYHRCNDCGKTWKKKYI